MEYNTSLFLFRRDIRLQDNTGLQQALDSSEEVIPCFCFDPRQISDKNDYRGDHSVQCLLESLDELSEELRANNSRLFYWEGQVEQIIEQILCSKKIDAIFLNIDCTPFSRKRDATIEKVCKKYNVAFHAVHDLFLQPLGSVVKDDGKPYTVFTPFWKRAVQQRIEKPQSLKHSNRLTTQTRMEGASVEMPTNLLETRKDLPIQGGRKAALKILRSMKDYKRYETTRDIPSLDATTHLSTHHKFGTVSVRETAAAISDAFGAHHGLLQELYWRDFFSNIAWHFPHVFGEAFYKKYDKLDWANDRKELRAWKEGTTGFPIVDAGMRELSQTGNMHNRVRMITASFLVKDLHCDWRLGEKHFATLLCDYDPAVNNGNWQWAASTGCDAQPYFRIFNPWLQQKKFDPDCLYIKKWIPELQDVPNATIHKWETAHKDSNTKYPAPIVNHKARASRAKDIYAKV